MLVTSCVWLAGNLMHYVFFSSYRPNCFVVFCSRILDLSTLDFLLATGQSTAAQFATKIPQAYLEDDHFLNLFF